VTRRTLLAAPGLTTAKLTPETARAFDAYVRKREAQIAARGRQRGFLWVLEKPDLASHVKRETVVKAYEKGATESVGDGLAHDWVGSTFIPGATLKRVLNFVQDYNRHEEFYRPEVLRSRLVSRNGDHFKIYLRLKKTKVITVVLDTEYDVTYFQLDPNRAYSRSLSTRMTELEDAGTPQEKELPAGQDHGFLWRLNTYWRFAEQDGGTYVECEAISLSRGIPMFLGPVVAPIIRSLPEDSLRQTLDLTRKHLLALMTP
jgi:hypothetical protein